MFSFIFLRLIFSSSTSFSFPIFVLYVVSSLVTTTSSPRGDGSIVDRVTGHEARIVQQGLEVPLGMLPFFALYAPTEAVEAAPEFVDE